MTSRPVARSTPRAVTVTLVVLLAFGAAACGGHDDGGGAAPPADAVTSGAGSSPASAVDDADVDPEGILRVGRPIRTAENAWTTDPGTVMHHNAMDFNRLAYEPLLRPLGAGEFAPALATSWEVVDPHTIELELREGVTFQDGTPVDAEAVASSILYNRDAGDLAFRRPELQAIETVEATGPLGVRITFAEPWAGAFLHQLSTIETLIVSPAAVESGEVSRTAVGAGPFKIVSIEPDVKVVLEKWDGYYAADDIRLKGIELIYIPPDGLVNALRAGEVDVIDVSADLIDLVEGIPGIAVESSTSMVSQRMGMCKSQPPFDDVRVREALNLAIDRDEINDLVFGGRGEPMVSSNPSWHPLYDDRFVDDFSYDPERAQELLAEAGATDLEFDIVQLTTGFASRMGELVQEQLAEIGVTVNIVPTNDIIADWFESPKADGSVTGTFQDSVHRITTTNVDDVLWNVCRWNDPQLTELTDEMRGLDPASPEYEALWRQAEERMVETAVSVNILHGVETYAWNEERVGNFASHADTLNGERRPDLQWMYIRAD